MTNEEMKNCLRKYAETQCKPCNDAHLMALETVAKYEALIEVVQSIRHNFVMFEQASGQGCPNLQMMHLTNLEKDIEAAQLITGR